MCTLNRLRTMFPSLITAVRASPKCVDITKSELACTESTWQKQVKHHIPWLVPPLQPILTIHTDVLSRRAAQHFCSLKSSCFIHEAHTTYTTESHVQSPLHVSSWRDSSILNRDCVNVKFGRRRHDVAFPFIAESIFRCNRSFYHVIVKKALLSSKLLQ